MQETIQQNNEFRVEEFASAKSLLDDMSTYGYQNIADPFEAQLRKIGKISDAVGLEALLHGYDEPNIVFRAKIASACKEICKYDQRLMNEDDLARYTEIASRLRFILTNISDFYIRLRGYNGICGSIDTLCYEYKRSLGIRLGVEM